MSKISLSGDASGTGTFTIASPNSNSNYTLTLPQATTTLVGTDATQTLTNKTLTSPTITGANMSSMASSVITSATAQASTSGTSIDFTSIPSWVKRITVIFNAVSTNGNSDYRIQLGDSGGIETTGYTGYAKRIATTGVNSTSQITNGLGVTVTTAASVPYLGQSVFVNISGNIWVGISSLWQTSDDDNCIGGTVKTLSGTLDRIRITTTGGTDTFDAGSINILYE